MTTATNKSFTQVVREGARWWWAVLGAAALVGYGFVPTLQHIDFARAYAVYGGYFIVLALLPDVGDVVGSVIALAGVCVVLYWPGRHGDEQATADTLSPSQQGPTFAPALAPTP
eukprot:jgi/Chlat1/7139/Chrsp57S09125